MNEYQITFDQHLQASLITMARPGFETFSIRGSWNCAAGSQQRVKRVWTHSSIEQWHELPDDITRKDGHGNVAVTPRPATSGDSAD
jgi:hypothetical protein